MKQFIQQLVSEALKNAFDLEKEILVDIPKDESADYTVNTALQCSKELGKNPREIAEILKDEIESICHSGQSLSSATIGEPGIQSNNNSNLTASGGFITGSRIKSGMTKEARDDCLISPFEKIEISGPGFLYFTLTKKALTNLMQESIQQTNWGKGNAFTNKKIMIEFACPNTHKAFHIGHLRNICLGESIVRLKESQGAETFRSNYQGDIGPHVAKCLWALESNYKLQITNYKLIDKYLAEVSKKTPEAKAKFLGKMYAQGGSSYEENEDTKQAVQAINKSLYDNTASNELINIYKTSRQWSLDYFEHIYARLGTQSFDKYFFESETWKAGKEIVEKNTGKVFSKSEQGEAIIFEGENFGLHTRVFISSEGNPTYEAKEVGLAPMQKTVFDFDTCIHVVANEQAEYFKVVFKAMEELGKADTSFPDLAGKEEHLSYGMVKLTSGKMSSRTGDVITAEWLINEAKTAILEKLESKDLTETEKEEISEQVALGAIKFTMLHTQAKNDIAFDLEKAVRLDGDSGPYIQYAHARICSILRKVSVIPASEPESSNQTAGGSQKGIINDWIPGQARHDKIFNTFTEADWKLLQKIQYLPYHIERCATENTAHYLSHYLLKLTSDFSSWYANNSVQNAETEELKAARIELLKFLQKTLKTGLYYMGIEAPEKM